MKNKALLIIDPQNSFIDTPNNPGSLAVAGAYQDMLRLAKRISDNPHDYDAIFITLDTHSIHDIAHPDWWRDANGQPPNPFTLISASDVESGTWHAAKEEEQAWSLSYVQELEVANKYKLCVWPPHCIEGTAGWTVSAELQSALDAWETKTGKTVSYIKKGENPNTEHYSGFKAEVVIAGAPETAFNNELATQILFYNTVEVAGEALSHCVASSVDDLLERKKQVGANTKVVLLADCMSSVTGFEANGQTFLERAANAGAVITFTQKSSPRP